MNDKDIIDKEDEALDTLVGFPSVDELENIFKSLKTDEEIEVENE